MPTLAAHRPPCRTLTWVFAVPSAGHPPPGAGHQPPVPPHRPPL